MTRIRKPVLTYILILFLCLAAVPAVPVSAEQYNINGTKLPLEEDGYRTGDYRGAGKCWEFAEHIYYQIWDRFFYMYPGSEDDMLRDYPGGEERRITADHARLFLTAAPCGSVVRLQEAAEGADDTEGSRHSFILLQKDDAGCTIYHDWAGYATISTYSWEEFENSFRTKIDFGYFKYIKYPGARVLAYNYTGELPQKELVVSSRIYGTVELLQKKR